jgi:hypothetical protein
MQQKTGLAGPFKYTSKHHTHNEYYDGFLAKFSLQSNLQTFPHTVPLVDTSARSRDPEDNEIHASFCVGVGNKFCVIFSNAKDEARHGPVSKICTTNII